MAEPSIFTKIINGEIPCHKVYEDGKTLAFLTINPVHPAHTLVIPKVQVDHLWDLEQEDYQAVMATTQKVAQRIREVFKPNRVGVHVAGTEVPHAHVHVFPFESDADFWDKPSSAEPDHAALAEVAKKLAF